MAVRLGSSSRRLIVYFSDFKSAIRLFRAYSSRGEEAYSQHQLVPVTSDSAIVFPDPQLGPFSPADHRFPLPGQVSANFPTPALVSYVAMETKLPETPEQRHHWALTELQKHSHLPKSAQSLECIAQDCPVILKSDLQSLFPERDISHGCLTLVTLSQKTEHDMSGWSNEVEQEREVLLEQFIEAAQQICQRLLECGFWADFIDPSSGRPYLGAFTNATLFETDERYRHFGFEIEDLGCCKVIRHHLWGTHAYVGSVFTSAPSSHPILLELLATPHDT